MILSYHTPFNLRKQVGSYDCPSCAKPVIPETCGFYQCLWRYSGLKTGDKNRLITTDWRKADDGSYHRFEGADGGNAVDWDRLFIETRPLPYDLDPLEGKSLDDYICPICLDFVESYDRHQTPCNHLFHKGCVAVWLALSHHCPLCRSEQPELLTDAS